jgi:hypothetical protein
VNFRHWKFFKFFGVGMEKFGWNFRGFIFFEILDVWGREMFKDLKYFELDGLPCF